MTTRPTFPWRDFGALIVKVVIYAAVLAAIAWILFSGDSSTPGPGIEDSYPGM